MDVFNYYGSQISTTATGRQTWRVEEIEAFVDDGIPVIVYGWFLPPGHVVVLLGHDDEYYYCNDSAGRWNEQYKGDFVSYDGEGVAYRKEPFLRAVAGDGSVWAVVPNHESLTHS